MFFFQISTDLLCIYDKPHYICSSTELFLIFILINNLRAVKNPDTLLTFPLNISGLAISMLDLVLG